MSQFLTLSRAARLVGVSRGALQKKIQNSELSTFEGKIAITELLRVYPETQMEDTTMLERVERIKAETTYDRRQEQSELPHPQVLATRLIALSQELISTQSELKRYVALIETLSQKLFHLQTAEEVHLGSNLKVIYHWLMAEIEQYSKVAVTEPTTQLLVKDTVLRIMAAHVKLIPSGHEFWVDGANSLLESALQTGLAINYGCTSGSCGLCKARIVSGEVQKIRHHDYVIGETEKNMGYRLMCSYTAVTDLVIEAGEAHKAEDLALQQIEAKVKKLENLTENLLILHLQTPRTETLRFFAGQSVTLTLDSGLSTDCFIASCPCDGRSLEFHLLKPFNKAFVEAISGFKMGQSVHIEGPKGHFTLQEDSTRPTLFIAYSHGFAAIKSLIEQAIALDTIPSYHLYWFTSQAEGPYQNNQCRVWADALDHFQYTPLTIETDEEIPLTQIVTDYPELNDKEVYVVGSETFITAVQNFLVEQHHLPFSQFHEAIF